MGVFDCLECDRNEHWQFQIYQNSNAILIYIMGCIMGCISKQNDDSETIIPQSKDKEEKAMSSISSLRNDDFIQGSKSSDDNQMSTVKYDWLHNSNKRLQNNVTNQKSDE